MLIACPHCGTRPVEEFTFLGDAKPQRPTSAEMDEWHDYVYLRDNPKGMYDEYVHHSGGCRSWLVVSRNTLTHDVQTTVAVQDYKRKQP
jgi:methylglutamate dehydrogenase subunit B